MNFARFETRYPDLKEISGSDGICYWIQEPICWIAQDAVKHYLPAFMVSDGYSIPPWLRSLIRGLKSSLPAFLHDYQFWSGECSLWTANNNIRRAVIATDSGRYDAWKIWIGLQIGGWKTWNEYKDIRKEFGADFIVRNHIASSLEEAIAIANL